MGESDGDLLGIEAVCDGANVGLALETTTFVNGGLLGIVDGVLVVGCSVEVDGAGVTFVGIDVGKPVGRRVVVVVGDADGVLVGVEVGSRVGMLLGGDVGPSTGDLVGDVVGGTLGGMVGGP